MARILQYRQIKGAHMYTLYANAYCMLCDEPIDEHLNLDRHIAKIRLKRAWRQHTPRLCKKRYARVGRSYMDYTY